MSPELGTTELGTRELGGGEVTADVSGTATSRAAGVTNMLTRTRDIESTAAISQTSSTTNYVRVGAFVPQTLSKYFGDPFPRDRRSVIRSIVAVNQNVVGRWSDEMYEVKQSHQVNHARGDDIALIGQLHGRIGERRKRDLSPYRTLLRSVTQSFQGRGTPPGVRYAIAAGLSSDGSNIELVEDFTENEFEVEISEWEEHRIGTVNKLAELADPSGVEFSGPAKYLPDGFGVKPRFGRLTPDTDIIERVVDIDGFEVTPEMGPATVEVVTEGIGSGQIGDGTQIGPESD
jgi:hypothetical protein